MHDAKLFLAGLLHVSIDDLEKALTATYEERSIRKRDSGVRTLSIPEESLRSIQRRILKGVLYRIELPHVFHGFRRKHSIVTNAEQHKPGIIRYWLKVDLKDAFPNVKESHFRELADTFLGSLADFRSWRRLCGIRVQHMRYDHAGRWEKIDGWPVDGCGVCRKLESEVAATEKHGEDYCRILRKLFRQLSKANPIFKERYEAWLDGSDARWAQHSFFETYQPKTTFVDFMGDAIALLIALTFHDGSLPQGSPSSPYLLNLSLWFSGLVKKLEKLAKKIDRPPTVQGMWQMSPRFRFTIYADDITFSSSYSFRDRPFDQNGDRRTVQGMILSVIEADGWYRVNSEKIHRFDFKKGYPLVTGLRVSKKRIGLSKKKIQWLRSFIYHGKNSNDPNVRAQLKGWNSYVRMIYRVKIIDDFRKVPSQIRDILVL